MRIAIAQINPTVGDLKGNLDKIREHIDKAKQYAADIIVFPEMALTGYPLEDLLLNPRFVCDNIEALESIAKHTDGVAVICGFVDSDDEGRLYNAAAVFADGQRQGTYYKQKFSDQTFSDKRNYFSCCANDGVFSFGNIKFGVNISEDMRCPDGPYLKQAVSGAHIIFDIAAEPYYVGKTREKEQLLSERARLTGSYICYAGLTGGQDGFIFDGGSVIVDPSGITIASGRVFGEDLVVADVDLPGEIKKSRAALTSSIVEKQDAIEEIYRALILGTEDYIKKSGFRKCVVGLSGGLDSALVAVIAREAVGAENVTAISMPSVHSSSDTRKDAKKMAANLGIEFLEIPIDDLFEAYSNIFTKIFKDKDPGVAGENIQARIRGNILMSFSNKFGQLVLTTGNKSELAVGYCTLYGDMAGGFAILSDVSKTVVYELAEHVNKKEGEELILASIISRPPSAELRPGQKDSDSLPPYDVLDAILRAYIEENKSCKEIVAEGVDGELLKEIINMVNRAEYKRRQSPPGIKITRKAFGKDRCFPITNKYFEPGI